MKSETETKSRTRRSRSASDTSSAEQRTDLSARQRRSGMPLTPEERHRLISEAAYQRAEQRGFSDGDPLMDWLEAEREVDAEKPPVRMTR
jgi:hypothetical protein